MPVAPVVRVSNAIPPVAPVVVTKCVRSNVTVLSEGIGMVVGVATLPNKRLSDTVPVPPPTDAAQLLP